MANIIIPIRIFNFIKENLLLQDNIFPMGGDPFGKTKIPRGNYFPTVYYFLTQLKYRCPKESVSMVDSDDGKCMKKMNSCDTCPKND